jgi:hypothetical protein
MGKLVIAALVAGAGALVARELPAIKRYQKIASM